MMNRRKQKKQTIPTSILQLTFQEKLWEYLVITIGCAVFAAGVVLFLLPYKVAPGGVTGVAVIVNNMLGYPAGLTMLVLNVLIFLVGFRMMGTDFSAKSLYATGVIALLTDLFNEVLGLQLHIQDHILAPVFGGVVFGVGLGLIVRMGGGTSGSNTIARIISKYTNLKQGASIMVVNTGVVAAAGVIFESADLALYGFLAIYSSSVVIDIIVEGLEYARGAYIISERAIEIADVIVYEMQRGVTSLSGKGFYKQEDRMILFTVMQRKEIPWLVSIVKKLDPKAFVIITPVHEVLGEGFRVRTRLRGT